MISTVTLNPAIDKLLFFNQFQKGITNRITDTQLTIGGKGTHVSMNLSVMGMKSRAFGLAYGKNGRYIMGSLKEWGVETRFVYRKEPESRVNCVLIENDGMSTLISDRGHTPSDEDTEALLTRIRNHVRKNECMVFAGDTSNYPDPHIYGRIMRALTDKNMRFIVDASGDTLAESLAYKPFLIKPNEDELATLCKANMDTQEAVVEAAKELHGKYGIPNIAVSLGARGSIVLMPDGIYKAVPPEVRVNNTVGCGDCFLAGLLYGFESGMSGEQALRYATAVSSAAAESQSSVGFDKDRAQELLKQVFIEKLSI